MLKERAIRHFKNYLKERNIYHLEDIDKNGTPTIILSFDGFINSPSRRIEACVWFYSSAIELRAYYAEPGPQVCAKSKNLQDLYRLLNFLNARMWPNNQDGAENSVYYPSPLIPFRFYCTEDNCFDITATCITDYAFFNVAPLELEDFVTAGLPDLLERLSPYIFGVLVGNFTAEKATLLIKADILRE